MASIIRTVQDLNERFNIQLELLKLACTNYDNNIEIAGFNMATSIRAFLHDTRNSTSALTHIGRKAIDYLNNCTVNSDQGETFTGLIYSCFEGVQDGQRGIANSAHSLQETPKTKLKIGLILTSGGIRSSCIAKH